MYDHGLANQYAWSCVIVQSIQYRTLFSHFLHLPNHAVPFVEILCSKIIETKRYRWLWYPFAEKIYQMEVYTFRRAARNPSMWLPRRLVLGSPRERILQELNMAINSCLSKMKNRPKTLLVFVNPYGGRKRATRVYEQFVAPVFAKSGIKASVMTTKYGGDARDQILSTCSMNIFHSSFVGSVSVSCKLNARWQLSRHSNIAHGYCTL